MRQNTKAADTATSHISGYAILGPLGCVISNITSWVTKRNKELLSLVQASYTVARSEAMIQPRDEPLKQFCMMYE